MIPEIGHFCLVIALFLSLLQCLFPIFAENLPQLFSRNQHHLFLERRSQLLSANKINFGQISKPLNIGATFFICLAVVILIYSFVQDDFSVKYIALHSNSHLPLRYKLSALWGGHEGSLLLWILILSLWSLSVNLAGKKYPPQFLYRVLSVLGALTFVFILFLLLTSNPFERNFKDFLLDGVDLNPLLQDPGLIFHPPLLYLGYVGTSVPYAFVIAALWDQRPIEGSFAHWVRSYVLIAFAFLTLGIALGSYWAYYELGWGGWWFWDPVENASFMPWLTSIALIHSLIVQRKRQQFPSWTLLLIIFTFGLSLLGTFLVRSGSLTSVHAFATDPERGIFILLMFLFFVGGALFLWGIRTKHYPLEPRLNLISRESLILLNTIIIVVLAASILLGTLFPMIYDYIYAQKISVGPPYFNAIFIPFIIPVLLSIPLGPFLKWGKNNFFTAYKPLNSSLIISILLSVGLLFYLDNHLKQSWNFATLVGYILGFWVCFGSVERLIFKYRQAREKSRSVSNVSISNVSGSNASISNVSGSNNPGSNAPGTNAPGSTISDSNVSGAISSGSSSSGYGISVGALGMVLAHFGIGLIVLGVVTVSNFQIEKDLRLKMGQSFMLTENEQIDFMKIDRVEGSNFIGYKASFSVKNKTGILTYLNPEKRNYVIQDTMMSETAIHSTLFRDIYLALGERLPDGSWTVRAYWKPGIRFIWLGAILIAFACLFLIGFEPFKKRKAK